MMDDSELLRRYAGSRANEAFAELVRRHVQLVYRAALRQCGGDAHRAEDVTQLAAQGRGVMDALRASGYRVKAGAENTDWPAVRTRAQGLLLPAQMAELDALVTLTRGDAARNKVSELIRRWRLRSQSGQQADPAAQPERPSRSLRR